MEAKVTLKLYNFVKSLLENLIILLVWFSCIFKQNVFSLILFAALTIYTFKRTSTTLYMVRIVVAIIFCLQYWQSVVDLSSYNSTFIFPSHLVSAEYPVYPSPNEYYFSIPLIMTRNATRDEATGQIIASNIDTSMASFFGMDITNAKINGIWIDFVVTVLGAIYFTLCNTWVLYRPIKMNLSPETETKVA